MSRVLPVLFNTEMVKAILDGRKTVTRRLVKPQPDIKHQSPLGYCVSSTGSNKDIGKYGFGIDEYGGHIQYAKPPCKVGDILYVRETYASCKMKKPTKSVPTDFKEIYYIYKADEIKNSDGSAIKWHPSIHMPKEAARIFLEVTAVRVERLREMNTNDFLKEGICLLPKTHSDSISMVLAYAKKFKSLWDSTISEEWQKFDKNPWVWVIEFERCEKPSEVEINEL